VSQVVSTPNHNSYKAFTTTTATNKRRGARLFVVVDPADREREKANVTTGRIVVIYFFPLSRGAVVGSLQPVESTDERESLVSLSLSL